MNREEMLERLANGEDPLDLSIRKWQNIVEGTGTNEGTENCALCHLYEARVCEGCPISKAGFIACTGTPYEEYCGAFIDGVKGKELIRLAQLEVDFLKGLKETTAK